jgi:hypothetical protein
MSGGHAARSETICASSGLSPRNHAPSQHDQARQLDADDGDRSLDDHRIVQQLHLERITSGSSLQRFSGGLTAFLTVVATGS